MEFANWIKATAAQIEADLKSGKVKLTNAGVVYND